MPIIPAKKVTDQKKGLLKDSKKKIIESTVSRAHNNNQSFINASFNE